MDRKIKVTNSFLTRELWKITKGKYKNKLIYDQTMLILL